MDASYLQNSTNKNIAGNINNFNLAQNGNKILQNNFVNPSPEINYLHQNSVNHINMGQNENNNFVNYQTTESSYFQNNLSNNYLSSNINSFSHSQQNENKILANNFQNPQTDNLNTFNSVYKPGNWYK